MTSEKPTMTQTVDLTEILSLPEDRPSLYFRYEGQSWPESVFVEMDDTGRLTADHAPDLEYYVRDITDGVIIRLFEVPPKIDVRSLKTFVKDHLDLIQTIHNGHSVEELFDRIENTYYLVGDLTEEAERALEKLRHAAQGYEFKTWYVVKPDKFLATLRDDQIKREVEVQGSIFDTAQAYLEALPNPDVYVEGGAEALADEIYRRMRAMGMMEEETGGKI
jgi:hypothetical protein